MRRRIGNPGAGRGRALGLVVLLCPLSLSAQQRDSIRVDSTHVARAYRVEGVTVRVARPALTTGGASAVTLRLDSVDAPPAPTLEEVLRQVPLIQIRTNSRGEAQPSLRGSEDRQVAVLMDGVPLTLGWDHRTDLSIIPLTAARNVTLLRGLSSVLYGPNTLGGVVEVDVARSRSRTERVDPLTVGFRLDQTGSTQLSATGAHIFEGAFSQWVTRAGAGFQDRRGFPLPEDARRDRNLQADLLGSGDLRLNSDVRRVDGFLSTRWLREDGAWASFAASGYDVSRGVPPEAHQRRPRLWRYPDQRRILAAMSAGTGQKETMWGTGDLEASLGLDLGSYRIDAFASPEYARVVEWEEGRDRTATLRLLGDHSLGSSMELKGAATWADVTHDETLSPGDAARYRQRLWSLGAEAEWRITGGTRMTAGVAADGADTPETGGKPRLATLWDWGARVGMSSLVNERLSVHGGVSRRSRFPSLRELYSGALGRFRPNPNLRPETLMGSEAGITWMSAGTELQAVVFHHRIDDGIVRRSITDDGVRRFQRINQDRIRSTGLELLSVLRAGRARISGDLTLQKTYGLDMEGRRVDLEYEPSVYGRVEAETPLPGRLRGSAQVRFTGAQMCEDPERGGMVQLEGSRTVDVALRRTFSFPLAVGGRGRSEATLSVRNLTDALAFDQCGLPQPGRTVSLQIRLW
ncbi:MAG: TonB-dependent receptor plug domain-containing protein [Gemmatimonadota bacterium]